MTVRGLLDGEWPPVGRSGDGMEERLETVVDREGWLIVRDPAVEDRWLATDSAVTAPD